MAFKRWQKAPNKKGVNRSWSSSELKIISWCLNNNIKIGVSPDWKDESIRWQIDISINDNIHNDPNRYNNNEILEKKYEYYKYYYDKYNK